MFLWGKSPRRSWKKWPFQLWQVLICQGRILVPKFYQSTDVFIGNVAFFHCFPVDRFSCAVFFSQCLCLTLKVNDFCFLYWSDWGPESCCVRVCVNVRKLQRHDRTGQDCGNKLERSLKTQKHDENIETEASELQCDASASVWCCDEPNRFHLTHWLESTVQLTVEPEHENPPAASCQHTSC